MKLRLFITIIILLALGFIVYKSVNFHQLSTNIHKFPQKLLYLALILSTLLTALKTLRLRMLLKKNNIKPGLWPSYRLFAASQAVTALPGGEASRAYFVTKETNATLHQAATPVLIQALLELFSAISIVIACSFFYPKLLIPGLIAFVFLLIIMLVLTNSKILLNILNKTTRFHAINKHASHIMTMQKDLKHSIFHPNSYWPTKTIVSAFLLGIFTNIIGGFLIIIIASGFNQSISLFDGTFAYAGGVAIQGLATVSPGGLGFTEGGMTGILNLSGTKSALEIVLIYRFVTFIYYTLIGLLFIFLFYRKDLLASTRRKQ